ncbi:MAG: 16S rRNA (cytosine(1402)-N(4))-methyltransferase [Proteobacteria bacterium]|nr:MAG: 16S rRNA (cytosine(1402)-N(4))-methyltransferase [Pseudomonadota bacterium]
MTAQAHLPVLLSEAIDALMVKADGVYVDCTYGRGGHSNELLRRLGPRGKLIAIDRDSEAVEAGRQTMDPRFTVDHARFGQLAEVAHARGVDGADGILMDLGVSSPQLEDARRGFSFKFDGPLDMRMDVTRGTTAAQWLAAASENQIGEVIKAYGEERFARQIARAIVAARSRGAIGTTQQLAKIVEDAVRTRESGQDPATRTFQALRIFVNQELEELSLGLAAALALLKPAGRLVVIAFHSLEDRIVKRFMRSHSLPPPVPRGLAVRESERAPALLRLIGKPVRPLAAEVAANPRARSAIMRIAERVSAAAA